MAGPENMAEIQPPEGGLEQLQLSDRLRNAIIEARERRGQPSQFEVTETNYRNLRADESFIPGEDKEEFGSVLQLSREQVDSFVIEAENVGILDSVKNDLKNLYNEIKLNPDPRTRDLEHRIDLLRRAANSYTERLWSELEPALRSLEGRYRGVGKYVFQQACVAMEKEFRRQALSPQTERGDAIFEAIKEERVRERQFDRSPKFQPEASGWRIEFHWAESENDIIPSVQDWLRTTITEIPKGRIEKKHEYLEAKQRDGLDMLSRLRIRLEQEGQHVPEDNPTYERAKMLIESQLNILGGERVVYRGGWEYFIYYLENFANDFNTKELNGHYDVIYLSDEMIPIMLQGLSEDDGIYWRGSENTVEKPRESQIRAFQKRREGEIVRFAATHRLFLTEDDFENRDIGFGDRVESKLLDLDNQAEQLERAGSTEAAAKLRLRRNVFRRIRDMLDRQEGLYPMQGLQGLTEEQREIRIMQLRRWTVRNLIIKKMTEVIPNFNVHSLPLSNSEQLDKTLWEWVDNFNKQNRDADQPLWFPSEWDKARLSIDRGEKVLARALTKEELEAMYIEVDGSGYTMEEIAEEREKIRRDGIKRQQTEQKIRSRLAKFDQQLKDGRAVRIDRAKNNFRLARSIQIFFGLASRYGGTRIRNVDEHGEFQSYKPVFAEVRDRLKAMIDKEAADIKALEDAHGEDSEIVKEAKSNAVFAATHAFRELGIANDLPIWAFNALGDEATLKASADVLASYGVEVAPGVSVSHDDREIVLYDIFERARRAIRKVQDDVAAEAMEGRFVLTDGHGKLILDKNGKPLYRRLRLNHKGGNIDMRRIFDARYIISTSGGVALPDLISRIADLGVMDLAWEFGCQDLRELSGFIYRRNETEFQTQAIWDTLDARDYKNRLRDAEVARRFLVARGERRGEGEEPIGLLQEPFSGAFRIRELLETPNNWRNLDDALKVRELKEFKPEILDKLTPVAREELTKLVAEVLKPLIGYMKSRLYVSNRLGRATRSQEYDNTLIWYAYRDFVRTSIGKGEGEHILGPGKLDYAFQARTEPLLNFYFGVLEASLYHILFEDERRELVKKGWPIKQQADQLRASLRQQGPIRVEADQLRARWKQQGLPEQVVNTEVNRQMTQKIEVEVHKLTGANYAFTFAEEEPELPTT